MTTDNPISKTKAQRRVPLARLTGYAALRDYEKDVLDDLRYFKKWARPLDVGGSNRSHHSRTLTKLVKLGFAESRYRGWCNGGSKLYRALPHNMRTQAPLAATER